MNKQKAIEMLGGTVTKTANAIGIRPQAVSRWPDTLTPKISDRVHAAHARMQEKRKPRSASSRAPSPQPETTEATTASAG